jgi:hypothetical protein
MIKTIPLLFMLCTLTAAFAPNAFADFYQYTDGGGAVNITNKLDAVPRRYRSTMKVVREDPARKKAAHSEPAPPEVVSIEPASQSVAPANLAGRLDELGSRFPWFKPLLYLFAILAVFTLITKVTTLIPSRLFGRLIYLAFTVGVLFLLYKSYAEHLVQTTRKLKEDAAEVARKGAARQEAVTAGEAQTEGR